MARTPAIQPVIGMPEIYGVSDRRILVAGLIAERGNLQDSSPNIVTRERAAYVSTKMQMVLKPTSGQPGASAEPPLGNC